MSATPRERFVALDRLRALAVLLMIQGHAFSELLDREVQSGPWYRLHKLVHGLTAPMFLMGAGLAFGITTYPRWESFHAGGEEHRARLRRYASITLLGYALQLPGQSLRALRSTSAEVWREILAVGPLQLIGVTLFVAQLTTRLASGPRQHARAALGVGLIMALMAPYAWHVEPASLDAPLLMAFLNGRTGSQFAAFPWMAYVLVALGLAGAVATRRGAERLRNGARWAAAGGLACGVTYTLYRLEVNPYGEHDFWHSSPIDAVFRMGGVALFLALASVLATRPGKVDRALAILARHSLLAYVTHLWLLYGAFEMTGLVDRVGRQTLSIEGAAGASLGLIALTVAVIVAWRHVQHTGLIHNVFERLTRLSSRWHIARRSSWSWTKSGTDLTDGASARGSVSPAPHSS